MEVDYRCWTLERARARALRRLEKGRAFLTTRLARVSGLNDILRSVVPVPCLKELNNICQLPRTVAKKWQDSWACVKVARTGDLPRV